MTDEHEQMSQPFSPEVMRYLAIVRYSVVDKEHGIPQTPVTQAMADEIAAADPYEVGKIIGSSMLAWYVVKDIHDHSMGVPDPERGHEALSPEAMEYLGTVRQKLDEGDEGDEDNRNRIFAFFPIVPAPNEAVVDEIKAADSAVLAEILYLSAISARAFANHVNTTPLPTPEEQEENLRRMYDAMEFEEMSINPYRFEEMGSVAWRLVRRALVHTAEGYTPLGDETLEVGGITDPSLAEQVAALHPDQIRGVCIELARRMANAEVAILRADHDDEEAVFLAVAEYRDGPE
jgi:hypothetical protein